MILSPLGDGISGIAPDATGLSSSVAGGALAPGERVIFPDNNLNHSPTIPVFSYDVPTPRTNCYSVMTTGHTFQFDSNDLGGLTFDSTGADDQHPALMTIGSTGATTHIFFGSATNGCLFSATSHQIVLDAMFKGPTPSDVTNKHYARFAITNVLFGAITHGAAFELDAFASGAGGVLITASAGVKTTTATGLTIIAGSWYRVRLVVTNATRVDLYVAAEGSPLPSTPTVSNTTNIPSGTGAALTPSWGWEHYVGAAARSFACSYFLVHSDRLAA